MNINILLDLIINTELGLHIVSHATENKPSYRKIRILLFYKNRAVKLLLTFYNFKNFIR